MRERLNGLRYVVRTGIPWRSMPHDLPRWDAVCGQATRWMRAGCFDALAQELAQDLRAVLRMADGRAPEPLAAVLDSRTLRSTPESGARAGYDGAKRKNGSKTHLAVDTLGYLLALHVTAADASDRAAVERLAQDVQDATGESVEVAFVDQGYTGEQPAAAAASPWHPPRGGQAARGEAGLRSAAAALRRRAVLRLGYPLSSPRPRLRMPRPDPRRYAHRRLLHAHAQTRR